MDRYKTYHPAKRRQAPAPKRRLRFALAVLLVIAVAAFGFLRVLGNRKISSLSIISEVISHQVPPKTITPLVLSVTQQTTMADKINTAIRACPDMDIGVAVQDLNDRKTYTYGLTEPFIAASVGKLVTATMYLHGTETDQYSLSKKLSFGTAAYELQQMIVVSDNQAWDDLARVLTHKGMSSYMRQMGVADYDPADNTLAPGDIALLLGKLYHGELLNQTDTKLLLSYMKKADYTAYIPASVPAGTTVYHKAGWLAERVNDAAIIDNGKHPYALVIFTKMESGGTYDAAEGHQLYAAITDATLQAFTQ